MKRAEKVQNRKEKKRSKDSSGEEGGLVAAVERGYLFLKRDRRRGKRPPAENRKPDYKCKRKSRRNA